MSSFVASPQNSSYTPGRVFKSGVKDSNRILLKVRNLSKTYGRAYTPALKEASFDITDGSFNIIYGASGSGKSTLINSLVGLDPPSSGTVYYMDKDLYKMTPNERAYFRAHTMGIVFQANYWVKSLNVLDNVALPLKFLGISEKKALKSALDSLERINMGDYAKKYPALLSGGEQQRVAVARATVNNPSYIVADEPTGNLDSKNGDRIIDLLRYFNKDLKRTIILVTHNMEYLPIADKLFTIQDGNLTENKEEKMEEITKRIYSDYQKSMNRWTN